MVDSGPNKFHLSSRIFFLFLKCSNVILMKSELIVHHFEVDAREKKSMSFCRKYSNKLHKHESRKMGHCFNLYYTCLNWFFYPLLVSTFFCILTQTNKSYCCIYQGALPQILENTKEDFFKRIIGLLEETSDICYREIKDIKYITCPHKPEGSMFVMVSTF